MAEEAHHHRAGESRAELHAHAHHRGHDDHRSEDPPYNPVDQPPKQPLLIGSASLAEQNSESDADKDADGHVDNEADDGRTAADEAGYGRQKAHQRHQDAKGDPAGNAADCAGQALFGEHWTGLLREFDEEWEKHERQNWLIGHLRLRHIGPVRGLAELAALHEACPADLGAKFAYAAALLHEGQADGVPIMEAVAREEPAYRARAFACVVGYYERKGDTKQVERWSAWLAKISKALGEALEPVLEQVEQGKARPGPLAGGERALLAEATRRDPCVRDAWLLEGSAAVRYAERRSVLMTWQLLVLRVDLAELQRLGQDEDSVAGRYQELLETLLPADHLPLVRTYFTTEPLPSAYGTYPRL